MVLDLVSEKFGIEKSIGIGIVNFWYFDFMTFSILKMVSDSASKKFGIEKSIGFGIVNF